MQVWQLFFGWPAGQVWPNLLASAITSAAAASLVAWRLLKKIRAEHAAHRELVAQQLAQHHTAVLAAVAPDCDH